ncbi:MAG: flagellar brake protein [Pseudodesulfovibrio sp.]|nr:flagellar brake protein [Pseudodesulfovibrio sp.]
MDLAVGDRILVEFSTFGDRFLSIVTDVKNDGRLVVYSPITDPIVKRLRTDRNVVVRYAHNGHLLGFFTHVINKIEKPGTVIELAKPDGVHDAEERCEIRCPCRFPAMVVDGDRAARVVVEDMSASCSRIRLLNGDHAPLLEEIGLGVQLTFHPFDIDCDGYSVGCVVRNTFMKDGDWYAVLEFNREESKVRQRIASYIEAQIRCGIPRL